LKKAPSPYPTRKNFQINRKQGITKIENGSSMAPTPTILSVPCLVLYKAFWEGYGEPLFLEKVGKPDGQISAQLHLKNKEIPRPKRCL